MKIVFISQPMRGKTEEEILKVRSEAIEAAKNYLKDEKDIIIIDSLFEDVPDDAKPLWYLGESIKLLANADLAVFAPGWELYRGCKIEYECCMMYEIRAIEI